ncbi:MAG: hypothetical protein GX451_05690 [Acholeplasmataceae bacterium]|nr:hypothetical protein [Acholeplasmataceae bacterium]
MEKDIVRKASGLLSEIEELDKMNEFLSNRNDFYFAIRQCYNNHAIEIPKRYTPRFVELTKEIISEMEKELEELK